MVYDSARQVCVLFGGQNTSGRLGDTWGIQRTELVQRANSGPAPRLSHYMAFDSRRGVTVLFGGFGGLPPLSAILGDTWEWDGTQWSFRLPLVSPLPRVSGSMDFDDVRGKVVLFAGGGDFRATAETWEYDGFAWSLRFANVSFWRITPAMCFDSSRGVSQAFGGILGNIRYSDEFEWDGSAWEHEDIPGPIGRSDSLMAYDIARKRVVLFGGESQQPARLNDTWELINVNPITISASPTSQSAPPGTPVTFSVTATGNGGLTYQWRRNGNPIAGAQGPTFTIASVNATHQGTYDVLVSNPCGTQRSAGATFSIIGNRCAADFNGSGSVDSDDLGDFINLFFRIPHDPATDFNGDGQLDPDDLGDFLNAFFAGC